MKIKIILKEQETWDQNQQNELARIAGELNKEYKLLKKLQSDALKSPDRATPQEISVFNQLVKPYLDKSDNILRQTDNINSPQELRSYLKNTFRPYIKESYPTLINFYNTASQQGITISKPYLNMIIQKVSQNVEHLRKMMQLMDQWNIQ